MDSHRAYGQYSTSINASNQNNGLPVPAASMLRNTHQVDESKRARFTQLLKQRMELFWNQQMMEIQNASDLRNLLQLPLSRIRRIIKSDPDVRMISGETPILFAKACELFIIELTLRAWLHTEDNKRPTLLQSDIARAIRDADVLDFLDDVVSLDEHKVEVPTNNPEENGFDPTTQSFTSGNPLHSV